MEVLPFATPSFKKSCKVSNSPQIICLALQSRQSRQKSIYYDVYNHWVWLSLQDVLNKRVAESEAFDPHDFTSKSSHSHCENLSTNV